MALAASRPIARSTDRPHDIRRADRSSGQHAWLPPRSV